MHKIIIAAIITLAGLHGPALADPTPTPADALAKAGDNAPEIRAFIDRAAEAHGPFGKTAAEFLVLNMPQGDLARLSSDFLYENLDLAFQAREEFPWGRTVPDEIFLNDVLPYASLDETRERWRKDFYAECAAIVKDCKTTTEAAQAINREFFDVVNVHYNTSRNKPNQSPSESIAQGRATCTGLAIMLVDACRTVGVPARVAGTALWHNKRGNHTWVEVWVDGQWKFTGADEYDAKGLNRGWFVGDAAQAVADDWREAIWASSWSRTGDHFPMVWDLEDESVPAVNVTLRYAPDQSAAAEAQSATLYLRVFDHEGGDRLSADVAVINSSGSILSTCTTNAGRADLNDMPSVDLAPGDYTLRLRHDGEERTVPITIDGPGRETRDLVWDDLDAGQSAAVQAVESWLRLLPEERNLSIPELALSADDAAQAAELIYQDDVRREAPARAEELEHKSITIAGHTLKFLEKTFGERPEQGHSLWISLHGGGGTTAEVNDQQWHNQIRLYEPAEGIYVAPRAPTDTWNMWHQDHMDPLLDRLITDYITTRQVNPDKVYIMGYSAGGDGVYQLAPRLADRFAAAAMMAGHPNDASPLGLRDIGFAIFVGGEDAAYHRNEVCAEWIKKLDQLHQADPDGYFHMGRVYEGLGHWMNRKDREALPWMQKFTRNPWPKKVVWMQDDVTHDRFYWLSVPADAARKGQEITAEVDGQTIDVTAQGLETVTLRLSDKLLDLDQPITIMVNGQQRFQGRVERTVKAINDSLHQRLDPASVASATVTVSIP